MQEEEEQEAEDQQEEHLPLGVSAWSLFSYPVHNSHPLGIIILKVQCLQ